LFQKIRELSKHLAIYGSGDVAIQALNFLLLPLYVKYLTKADYGVLALLASVEATVKLFFRWGVDGAFMRFWYDCEDEHARQRLASTLFFFLLGTNGVLLILALIASPFLSERLLQSPGYTLALQLVLLNTFAIGLGDSFRDVVSDVRLRWAVLLLSAPALPIRDIARASGYGSLQALGRAFRDAGLPPPSAVRRLYGQVVDVTKLVA